jgi:hypothetical protein
MKSIAKILTAGVILAGAGSIYANAVQANSGVYEPVQGLSYRFGSKLAVGYFSQKEGACALNIFVAENTGDDAGPSASRLQFKVMPGENVKLNSAEGESLEMKCGAQAATLEVKGGSFPARYVSR